MKREGKFVALHTVKAYGGEYQESPSSTLNGVSGEIHSLTVLKEYKMWSIKLALKDLTLEITINI
jgi:hypothetical protein